jgi:hypothetical protein
LDVAAELLDVAPASSSERQVLAIIVALAAGAEHPVDIGNALISVDVSNASRVLQALGHAAGHHARRATVVVDGHISEEGGWATSSAKARRWFDRALATRLLVGLARAAAPSAGQDETSWAVLWRHVPAAPRYLPNGGQQMPTYDHR